MAKKTTKAEKPAPKKEAPKGRDITDLKKIAIN